MKALGIASIGLVVSCIASQNGYAKNVRDWIPKKTVLAEVDWTGSFRCDEKIHELNHDNQHECDLEFVSDETENVWNVRSNPALIAMHQKYNGPVRVRVKALRSPRFLLGGSYVEVKQIEVLRNGIKDGRL